MNQRTDTLYQLDIRPWTTHEQSPSVNTVKNRRCVFENPLTVTDCRWTRGSSSLPAPALGPQPRFLFSCDFEQLQLPSPPPPLLHLPPSLPLFWLDLSAASKQHEARWQEASCCVWRKGSSVWVLTGLCVRLFPACSPCFNITTVRLVLNSNQIGSSASCDLCGRSKLNNAYSLKVAAEMCCSRSAVVLWQVKEVCVNEEVIHTLW